MLCVALFASSYCVDAAASTTLSPECAALILVGVGGGDAIAGAMSTTTVLNDALPTEWVRFAASSWTAWWESLAAPLSRPAGVAIRSTLRSVVLEERRGVVPFAALDAVLGADGRERVTTFCRAVDQADPDSEVGEAIRANLRLYQGWSHAQNAAEPYLNQAKGIVRRAWTWLSDKQGSKGRTKEKNKQRRPTGINELFETVVDYFSKSSALNEGQNTGSSMIHGLMRSFFNEL